MRGQTVCRAEGHHVFEIPDAGGAIGFLSRDADRSDRQVTAVLLGPVDRGVLDRLRLGVGPELYAQFEDRVVFAEIADGGMTEAVFILIRVEFPVL